MTRWTISTPISKEVSQELASLLQENELKPSILQALKILSLQADPRKPDRASSLIVDHLEIHAPGWFRLKLNQENVHIAFRLLVVRNEALVVLDAIEAPLSDEGFIDITYAGKRTDTTYQEIRRRYLKMKR